MCVQGEDSEMGAALGTRKEEHQVIGANYDGDQHLEIAREMLIMTENNDKEAPNPLRPIPIKNLPPRPLGPAQSAPQTPSPSDPLPTGLPCPPAPNGLSTDTPPAPPPCRPPGPPKPPTKYKGAAACLQHLCETVRGRVGGQVPSPGLS